MSDLFKENINNKNKNFIDYLNTGIINNEYKYFKFLIINSKDIKDEVEYLFEDVFVDPVYLYNDDDIVVIYHNEDEVAEKDYLDILLSISIDYGGKVKVFKGSPINYDNYKCLEEIYNVYKEYKNKDYIASGISDLILEFVHKDIKLLNNLKEKLLYKISDDKQLIKLILVMFECDLNVTKTAGLMYMHRNTINNKIDYIKKETGFNVQNFKDAMSLYILIKMV